MKRILLLAAVCLIPQLARADLQGVLLAFNGYIYDQTTATSPGGTSDNNTYIYDIKLGYIFDSGLYVGAIYNTRSQDGSAISTQFGWAAGGSVGYVSSTGLYLMANVYATAQLGDYTNGMGFQGDFGYLTNVSGVFNVGVEATYRDITYKGVPSGETSYEDKELFPMLTLAFVF